MSIKITKAKLKDELFLEVEYIEEMDGHGTNTVGKTSTVPVHIDLINQFKKLTGHLAMIFDEVTVKELVKVIDKYDIKGFSLKGEDQAAGVTLMGGKKTKYGYDVMNTPFQRFETSKYGGIGELATEIELCLEEVKKYLFEGKRAPDNQLSMFDAPPAENQDGLQDLANKATSKLGGKGKNKLKAVKDEDTTDDTTNDPDKQQTDEEYWNKVKENGLPGVTDQNNNHEDPDHWTNQVPAAEQEPPKKAPKNTRKKNQTSKLPPEGF